MNTEDVMQTFFAALQAVPGFTTYSRRQVLVEDCDAGLMPALYMRQDKEQIKAQTWDGIEAIQFDVMLFIYIAVGDETTPTMPVLNPLKDAILNALPPNVPNLSSPNGTVFEVRLDRDAIQPYEGLLGNKAVMYIPVKLLVPYNAA